MNYFLKGLLLCLAVFLMTGCAKVVIKSDSDPSVNLAALNTFYVQKFAPDKRGLEKIIAAKLNEIGFDATSGAEAVPPRPVDALVTYKDKWMWDITNYMLEINLEFRNPETNFMFASGKSYRTSLARKSPEGMIDEVIHDLFPGKAAVPK
jgi:hypothetical protein